MRSAWQYVSSHNSGQGNVITSCGLSKIFVKMWWRALLRKTSYECKNFSRFDADVCWKILIICILLLQIRTEILKIRLSQILDVRAHNLVVSQSRRGTTQKIIPRSPRYSQNSKGLIGARHSHLWCRSFILWWCHVSLLCQTRNDRIMNNIARNLMNPRHSNASRSNCVLFVRDIIPLLYPKDSIVRSCHSWTTSYSVAESHEECSLEDFSKSKTSDLIEFEIFDSDTGMSGHWQALCAKSSLQKNMERGSHQYSISHVSDAFTFDFFMSCSIDASLRMSHFVHTFRKYIRSRIHVLQIYSYSFIRLYIYRSKKVG